MSLIDNGFESAYSGWTSHFVTGAGTIGEVIAAAAHLGSYGFHVKLPASAGNMVYLDVPPSPILHARFYIKVLSLTASTCEIVAFQAGTAYFVAARLTNTGHIRCYNKSGALIPYTTSATAINDGLWHSVEYAVIVDPVNGFSYLWIDGNLECTTGPVNNSDTGLPSRVKVGGVYDYGGGAELYFDDIVIANSYIGPLPSDTYYVAEIIAGVGGVLDTTPPYLGEGTYHLGINPREYIHARAIPNQGFAFAGWNFWINGVVTPNTYPNPIESLNSGTPNRVLTIQPTFTPQALTRRVTFQSTPVPVSALLAGVQVQSGQGVDIVDGSMISIVAPAEVIV